MNIMTFVDIYATRYRFFNEKYAKIVCQILEIESEHLTNSNSISKFHVKTA